MIVVADTTPLNYLVLIDEVQLLPALFDKVLVPHAVFAELQHPEASIKVRLWLTPNLAGSVSYLSAGTYNTDPT